MDSVILINLCYNVVELYILLMSRIFLIKFVIKFLLEFFYKLFSILFNIFITSFTAPYMLKQARYTVTTPNILYNIIIFILLYLVLPHIQMQYLYLWYIYFILVLILKYLIFSHKASYVLPQSNKKLSSS